MKTKRFNHHARHLFATAALLIGITMSAQAANECKVEYAVATSYNSSSTEQVFINEGETKNINEGNVLYVKNLNSRKVRAYRSGAMEYIDLPQNGRDPGMGTYVGNVILQKVKCFSASESTPTYQTPAAMISALKGAGVALNQIAAQVVAAFNLGGAELAELLKAASYDAGQIAEALNDQMNLTGAQVAQALKDAGFSASQVAEALNEQLNLAGAQVAQLMKDVGFGAAQIADALKGQFNEGAGQIALWLRGVGFTASQVAAALADEFNHTAGLMAEWLDHAGYTAAEIAEVLKNRFNADSEQAAEILKNLAVSAADVATVLRASFNSTAHQAADILIDLYALGEAALRAALQAAGYAAAQIEEALTPPVRVGGVIILDKLYGPTSSNGSIVPLFKNRHPLPYEVRGNGLTAITSVTGLPSGAVVEIGYKEDSRLRLNILIPEIVQEGRTGTADLLAGRTKVGSFDWRVQAMPEAERGPAGGIVQQPARALPDVAPTTFVNQLYRVGSATTTDNAGSNYTALDPFNNSPYCQGIAQAGNTRAGGQTANRRDVRVPNIRWGVRNTSTVDVTTAFTIQLVRGQQVLATQNISALPAGQQQEFEYVRPQSTTTVARVGLGTGCYHAGMQDEGWNDNAGYQVRVDSGANVAESNENNNSGAL